MCYLIKTEQGFVAKKSKKHYKLVDDIGEAIRYPAQEHAELATSENAFKQDVKHPFEIIKFGEVDLDIFSFKNIPQCTTECYKDQQNKLIKIGQLYEDIVSEKSNCLKELKEAEDSITDLYHFIEFNEGIKMKKSKELIENLHNQLIKRRENLDKLTIINLLSTGTNVTTIKSALKEINERDNRVYTPKQLDDLFEGE